MQFLRCFFHKSNKKIKIEIKETQFPCCLKFFSKNFDNYLKDKKCITIWIVLFLAGFVISAICELERNAIQLALGSFYPTLLLSGTYKFTMLRKINLFGIILNFWFAIWYLKIMIIYETCVKTEIYFFGSQLLLSII